MSLMFLCQKSSYTTECYYFGDVYTKFIPFNLEIGKAPLPNDCADVVCAVEIIEHLEYPRAFIRKLIRLTKPGGLVIVTTPNQLSLLSKLTLILRNQFNAF